MAEGWRSSAGHEALRLRAEVYRYVREFFFARDVLEVETPILSSAGNTDPNIESLQLEFNGPGSAGNPRRWLRTSPEFPLKRLLACGIGDCYELGKVFRNGEYGRRHNPEFSMLEWYRLGWDHRRLIDECVALVTGIFALKGKVLEVSHGSYRDLFLSGIGIDPLADSDQLLREAVNARTDMDLQGLSRDDLLDLLLTHVLEPAMPANRLTVIYDFPASQCALARIRDGDPPVAERFELYVGAIELANGYHELNDAGEQRRRFNEDLHRRRQRGGTLPAIDENLLAALSDLPDCAGVAMGVDRLLMALLPAETMAQAVAFDFSRA
jgi:elongation factor P--(R)-beta-lysine ligase